MYALQIVDNDTQKGLNVIKELGQQVSGRVTIKVWYKVTSGTPDHWGLVLIKDYTDINDPTTYTKILAVSLNRSADDDVSVYDYNSGNYVVTTNLGINLRDNNWHMIVVQLDTSTGITWVAIDGRQVGRVAISANYEYVKAIEIDFAGSSGTGELHVDMVEVYSNCNLVARYDFEDNTTMGFTDVAGASGSVAVVEDEAVRPTDSIPCLMPKPLSDITAVYIPEKGKAYFGAGYSSNQSIGGEWYELDLSTGEITQKASMPQPVWGAPAVYHPGTGKIYVFGGSTGFTSSDYSNSIMQIYDPASDTWEQKTIPYSIAQGAMSVYNPLNGKIHIIQHGQHLVYDPASDTWEEKAAPPRGSRWGVLTYYNGKLWLVHGFSNDTNTGESHLYVYDPASDTWEEKAAPPFTNGMYGAVREWGWLNGKLYVVYYQDDGSSGKFYAEIYVYDPASDTWDKAGYGLIPRDGPAGFMGMDGYVYVLGGRDNHNSPISPNDQYEKINIRTTKVILFGPDSDVYAAQGDTLTVVVLDEDNNPVSNASVTINKDGTQYTTVTTDQNGTATFTANDPGTYTAVYNNTTSNAVTVTAQQQAQPHFKITTWTGSVTTQPGATFTVSVTVENDGGASGTVEVRLKDYNGVIVDSKQVTLDAGANAAVELNATAPDTPGTYTYTVEAYNTSTQAVDDSKDIPVTVQQQAQPTQPAKKEISPLLILGGLLLLLLILPRRR